MREFIVSFASVAILGTIIPALAPGQKMRKPLGLICSMLLLVTLLSFFSFLTKNRISFSLPDSSQIQQSVSEGIDRTASEVFASQLQGYLMEKGSDGTVRSVEIEVGNDTAVLVSVTVSGCDEGSLKLLKDILPAETEIKLLDGE